MAGRNQDRYGKFGLIPVLLGDGLRLFDQVAAEPIQLEQTRVIESPGRTDLRYRVVK
jgi:hypothetical protein